MNRKYCENSLSNIPQLFDSLGYIIFSKYEMNLGKQLTKLQNLTLFNTNLKFLCVISKNSLTHVCLITLDQLDPIINK